MAQEAVTYFIDPPPGSCRCNCGVVPWNSPEHYCDHDWSGWEEAESYGTAVCVKCGMTAISHDLHTGP